MKDKEKEMKEPGMHSRHKVYAEGEPCDHPGCLLHVTHPCERCGRIAGRTPLLPCPFCGEQPEIVSDDYYVGCTKPGCWLLGYACSPSTWNRRPQQEDAGGEEDIPDLPMEFDLEEKPVNLIQTDGEKGKYRITNEYCPQCKGGPLRTNGSERWCPTCDFTTTKPSIAELEAILDGPESQIEVLPSGEVLAKPTAQENEGEKNCQNCRHGTSGGCSREIPGACGPCLPSPYPDAAPSFWEPKPTAPADEGEIQHNRKIAQPYMEVIEKHLRTIADLQAQLGKYKSENDKLKMGASFSCSSCTTKKELAEKEKVIEAGKHYKSPDWKELELEIAEKEKRIEELEKERDILLENWHRDELKLKATEAKISELQAENETLRLKDVNNA